MYLVRTALVLLICLFVERSESLVEPRTEEEQLEFDHGVDLPTKRPLIVAHRGSSGTLPEHTVRAYQLAVDQGADVIECDLTITKDHVLICMHECWMSETTNVAEVYNSSRENTYFVQDQLRSITDYFTVDFTLEELSLVRKVQRSNIRDPNYDGQFGIATLEEFISVAQGAGRPVGIYIETKDPIFTNSILENQRAGVTFEDLLLDTLNRFKYTTKRSPCFLQSFNRNSLLYLANRTSLPLIVLLPLVGDGDMSNETLARYASFAYGIGPDKHQLVRVNTKNQIVSRSDLVQRAHAFGLRVHPFTLRNENEYLAWDYGQDPANEYADLFHLGIDGAFTDFPATYYNFLNYRYCDAVVSGSQAFVANIAPLFTIVLFSSMLTTLNDF